MSLRDYLEGVRECVLQGWTKDAYARDEHGDQCGILEARAVCFCLNGAMRRMGGNDDEYYKACEVLGDAVSPAGISGFNDTHTKAEVIGMLDRVIEVCP